MAFSFTITFLSTNLVSFTMEKNQVAKFSPGMDFFRIVADACKKILHDREPREKIISRYLKQGQNRKERDKLFKYVHSIVKDHGILDFITSRTKNSIAGGENETIDDHFLQCCIAFHVFEHRISERTFLPLTITEQAKIRESLGLFLEGADSGMKSFVETLLRFNMQDVIAKKSFVDYCSILYSHPSFFIEKMLEVLPEPRIEAILRAHQASENFFLVARDAACINRIKKYLVEKGFAFQEDRVLPNVLHIPNVGGWKHDLLDRALKAERNAMIQDLGSVMIVEALGIQPGDIIIDGCAAPFQKTITMSWHCGPLGRIIAFDAYQGRTMEAANRLDKTARMIIHMINADAARLHLMCRTCHPDKILLDVPCTGSGSLGAYPELKERQTIREIKKFAQVQHDIIASVIEACITMELMDTEIIYSTCSYYAEEGEEIIDSFWNDITLRDLHDPDGHGLRTWQLSHGWKGYRCSRFVARTFPDLNNGSKGFFIAKFTIASRS
ncbi:MAG TPA: RsmB/NOP family class I SAM-dependent RNA methyltransferase [Candidatus Lokiarchaeia archaeon]|nr:RsmB/NOP family class I SAM-dependent RNA methyltransferase [Candidatus Lokiarchaeia archaeon]